MASTPDEISAFASQVFAHAIDQSINSEREVDVAINELVDAKDSYGFALAQSQAVHHALVPAMAQAIVKVYQQTFLRGVDQGIYASEKDAVKAYADGYKTMAGFVQAFGASSTAFEYDIRRIAMAQQAIKDKAAAEAKAAKDLAVAEAKAEKDRELTATNMAAFA